MPKNLQYVLRFPSESRTPTITEPLIFNWHTNLLYPLFSTGGPRSKEDVYGGMPFYFQDGFLPIQDAIARSFTELSCRRHSNCENGTLPDIKMQRYPYPPHILDVLLQGLETIVSFFILLSFIYPCINTVRFIAIEKERQLKETMKIMGLPSWLHWTSWFVRTMIVMILSISLIVILLKVCLSLIFFFWENFGKFSFNFQRIFYFSGSFSVQNVPRNRCCIHILRLVNNFRVFICVQHFNDNILLYVERIFFTSEYSRRCCRIGVVLSLRSILIYSGKLCNIIVSS